MPHLRLTERAALVLALRSPKWRELSKFPTNYFESTFLNYICLYIWCWFMMALPMFSKLANVLRAGVGATLAVLVTVASAQIHVSTYHNDNLRTGLNAYETALSPTSVVPSRFGLLFSLPVDGQVYAQPLYLSALNIPGKGVHNVVFVATEHNSLYAFDSDTNTGPNAQPLWHVNFGASVPNGDTGSGDITNEIGITSTPVISIRTGQVPIIYVVSKVKTFATNGTPIYTQKLHAISAANGSEQLGGPVVIAGKVAGTGDAAVNGFVTFDPLIQHARAALLLVQPISMIAPALKGGLVPVVQPNTLYVTFASHGDNGPYHGWVFAYDADRMQLLGILNTTPNGRTDISGYPIAAGGIWQGGAGPASDGVNVFFATGNGTFNTSNGSYGDAIVRVQNSPLAIKDYFAPSNQLNLDDYDADLGSGGVMLLPPSAGGTTHKNLLVQSGKEGTIYLLNTANLGHYSGTDHVEQELPYVMGGIWGAPAFFNNTIYYGPVDSSIVAFPIANGRFTSTSPTSYTPTIFGYPGPTPSISSNGNSNGIVWAIQTDGYGNGTQAILHAYDATNLANQLYDSSATNGRDTLGGAVKFAVPTIANGKVFVGTANSVGVFGLGRWAATPSVTPDSGNYSGSVQVTITDSTSGATIRYTTDGSTPTATSTLYNGPFTLTTSTTLKARAFINGGGASSVVEKDYLVNGVIGNGTGLFGAYFDGSQNPGGMPTATELDSQINFNWNGGSPISGVGGSNWAGEWTGHIQAETTGAYTLTTNSDDGVRVYINGQLLINDWNSHGSTYDATTVNFTAGQTYTIDIKYFQGGGGSLLQLFWASPGIPFQLVPTSQLYPN